MTNKEISITIKLFSDLRQYGPTISTISVPENATIKHLLDEYHIPKDKKGMIIFVNGIPHHKVDYILNSGDVIALFPPTAGG